MLHSSGVVTAWSHHTHTHVQELEGLELAPSSPLAGLVRCAAAVGGWGANRGEDHAGSDELAGLGDGAGFLQCLAAVEVDRLSARGVEALSALVEDAALCPLLLRRAVLAAVERLVAIPAAGTLPDKVPHVALLTEQLIRYLPSDRWFAPHYDKDRRDKSHAPLDPLSGSFVAAGGSSALYASPPPEMPSVFSLYRRYPSTAPYKNIHPKLMNAKAYVASYFSLSPSSKAHKFG